MAGSSSSYAFIIGTNSMGKGRTNGEGVDKWRNVTGRQMWKRVDRVYKTIDTPMPEINE